MRRGIVLLLSMVALFAVCFGGTSYTEDGESIELAKVLYACAKTESYDTKLALGTVVMNRVADSRFPDTLSENLSDQMQFPAGTRYDEESLAAAQEVLGGTRTLSASLVYYRAVDAGESWGTADAQVGGYLFYTRQEVR